MSDFSNVTNDQFQQLQNLEYLSIFHSLNINLLTLKNMPLLQSLYLEHVDLFQIDLSTNSSLYMIRLENINFLKTNLCDFFNTLKNSNLKVLKLYFTNHLHFDTNLLCGLPALQLLEMYQIESITFSKNLSKFANVSFER